MTWAEEDRISEVGGFDGPCVLMGRSGRSKQVEVLKIHPGRQAALPAWVCRGRTVSSRLRLPRTSHHLPPPHPCHLNAGRSTNLTTEVGAQSAAQRRPCPTGELSCLHKAGSLRLWMTICMGWGGLYVCMHAACRQKGGMQCVHLHYTHTHSATAGQMPFLGRSVTC